MARFFLTLSYDGRDFNGWQIQDNTPNTVEQVLEEKLSMLLKEPIDVIGCGRTDAGVNARDFIAHFNSHHNDLVSKKAHWIYKFNLVLPPTISIQDIRVVHENAHARFDASERVYYYYLSRKKNPFRDGFTWYVYGDLDFERMNLAAATLLKHEDFTSFSKTNSQSKTNFCRITRAVWHQCAENEWRFTIGADRFLRGMVRAIVGTLVLVGKNKITTEEFVKIILAKDRKLAGSNAPANALFLSAVKYPQEVYID